MKVINQSVFDTWQIGDKSVQAIITSPPYYSLRRYSIEDVIIGGDKDCKHEWGEDTKCRYGNNSTIRGKEEIDIGAFAIPKFKNSDMKQGTHPAGKFCLYCNAWQGQFGLEPSFKLYLEHCKLWMQEAIRVLRDDGVIFINLGDSYASNGGASRHKGYNDPKYPNGRNGEFDEPTSYPQGDVKPKSKLLIPERFAIMCVDELGLILRNHICWAKPNSMPESVTDRFSKKWESIFMLTKKPDYYFNLDAIRGPHAQASLERLNRGVSSNNKWVNGADGQTPHNLSQPRPNIKSRTDRDKKLGLDTDRNYRGRDITQGKNPGDVWNIPTMPSPEKHFAMWPEKLVERMVLCSTKVGDIVLDCFCGSGTTLRVADRLNRIGQGIDLGYSEIQSRRLTEIQKELIYE